MYNLQDLTDRASGIKVSLQRQEKDNSQGGITILYTNSMHEDDPVTVTVYPKSEFLKSIPPSTKQITCTIKPQKENKIFNR